MKNKKNEKSKRPTIDYTSYFNEDMINYDVDGSYTGVPAETYLYGDLEQPVQDADDL